MRKALQNQLNNETKEKYRIIAVDDEIGIIESLSVFLGKTDYEFVGITDPVEAIETVKREHFDLMLLDFMMTPLHGDEVVEEISKYPQFERERLCKLAKDDMQERNPGNIPTDERGFLLQTASISNIALSEGISPSALYVLCVMNYDKYFKERLVNS